MLIYDAAIIYYYNNSLRHHYNTDKAQAKSLRSSNVLHRWSSSDDKTTLVSAKFLNLFVYRMIPSHSPRVFNASVDKRYY